MSSTNRGAMRVALDQYMTPLPAIESLMKNLNLSIVRKCSFAEPCRGTGNIYNTVPAARKDWAEISEGIDYIKSSFQANLIITNPPFSHALPFLEKSLFEADTIIYLLRLNFLGSKIRKPFWNNNRPTHTLVLSERPVFVWACKGKTVNKIKIKRCGSIFQPESTRVCPNCDGNVRPQTDSIEYAWFVWGRRGIVNLPDGVHVL